MAFILITPFTAGASPLAYPTERLAGQDRVETALAISQKGWDTAQTAILSEYSDYPDSIAATPFAASQDAPVLLTDGDAIDSRVLKELQRLKVQKVILLGGTGCLKPAIEQTLDKLSLKWERIGGVDRYETSILLAKRLTSDSLILANGDDFPDALSAAAFAGMNKIPIVLTSKSFPDAVSQYYQQTQPKHLFVIGGEGVIPSEELAKNKFTVEIRLGGQDRYETNAKVVSYMKSTYQATLSNNLFLASGLSFPDAVAGTVLASKYKAPLLLTETEDIPPPVYSEMRENMKIEPPAEPSATSANPTQQGKVTASGGLNLRESPTATGKSLGTIPEDTIIILSDHQGEWFKTTYQSKTGWVSSKYVAIIPLEQSPTATTGASNNKTTSTDTVGNSLKGTITASGGLNLRDLPSATGKTLGTIPEGTIVELTDQQDNWYHTNYQSKSGWVSSGYVTVAPQKGHVVASGGLVLRDTPDSTGKMMTTIPEGTEVDLIDLSNHWYKTSYQSKSGWISAKYVTVDSTNSSSSSSAAAQPTSSDIPNTNDSTTTIDLSVNGTVYILGGSGVISSKAEDIIEGKAASSYKDNLKDFPPLPAELEKSNPPSRGGAGVTPPTPNPPPVATDYDPAKEILVDPFQGIPAKALSGKTIMVDPGHGGKDTGAIGPSHTYEKNNTLAIALELRGILKQAGAKVILTRENDVSPAPNYSEAADLQARVDLANKDKVDLFVSIHNNSVTNHEVQGTSTYFSQGNPHSNESLQLANSIQFAVIDTIKTKDRGIKEAGFYVLDQTTMPAVLLETAFISNPYEEARLQNPTFRKNVAAAVFRGIYHYFTDPKPQD